jgi:UDP-N-acetylmuramate--alanine ligase
MEEFAASFDDAATVEILDIYAASEEPIEGVTAEALVKAVGREGVEYAGSAEAAVARVVARADVGDVILTLGAGSVSGIAPLVLEKLGS